MKGLQICEKYYEEYGREMIMKTVPQLADRIAVGLAGDGSQCYGFDDEISRDHDFAPGFCIWLTDEDFEKYGRILQDAYDSLPSEFMGLYRRSADTPGRHGVMSAGSFYSEFTGCPYGPVTNSDWLMCPETSLAACTNGKVFSDPLGMFSQIREKILAFYPDDVLRKKLAARAAVMSQAGQYNLSRSLKREDKVGASLACARFTEAALSMIHLLNRRYMPFYKWAYRSSLSLEKLSQIPALISELQEDMNPLTAEKICVLTAEELRLQGFSACESNFLQEHLPDIMGSIKDPEIAALPPVADFNF